MHFFIDHTKLPVQSSSDKYGPVDGFLTTKYNVTSKFQLTEIAKAFSCQDGQIIVQQSETDESLVNVILKPSNDLNINFQKVSYYVYRGLLKTSFFDESLVVLNNSNNTEIADRIKNSRTTVDSYAAKIFGFDNNTLSGTDHVESIFNNAAPQNIKPIEVKEGEWFGNFRIGEIGFEIILEPDKIDVSLNFVRKASTVINSSGLTNFDLRAKQEEILAFIDPVAFFGLHYSSEVKVSTYSGNTKTTSKLKLANLNTIISKFFTKNRVYLDIRSEKGYSYNFYQNYGDSSNNNIKLPTAQNYGTNANGWPIVFIEQTVAATILVNLRIDDNLEPILFIQNKAQKSTNSKSNFAVIEKEKVNDAFTGWSKQIKFKTPNTNFFASCIKLYYFRNKPIVDTPPINDPKPTLQNIKYYDSAFCPIDLPNLAGSNPINNWIINPNRSFIREKLQTNGTGNFNYTAYNGAYWDDDRVLFYSKLGEQLTSSEKVFLPTYKRKLKVGKTVIGFKDKLDVICRLYKKSLGSNQFEEIKILGINYYSVGNIVDKEISLLLGLTREELAAVQNTAGLSNLHHKYIHLEQTSGNPLKHEGSTTGNKFFEYRIRLQGLNSSGNRTFVTPTKPQSQAGTPILVYSRDNLFFHSKDFSVGEIVTAGANQIEFHIYSDGIIKISDNIDFSLFYGYKRIFYKYKNIVSENFIDICNLEIVKANEMERLKNNNDGKIGVVPVNYRQFKTYTSGSATASYIDDLTGNIVTTGNSYGIRQYLNQNKIKFMVFFERDLIINNNLGIRFLYSNTQRRYANPGLAASLLGALIDIDDEITSTGFSFADGTCYPSAEHVNGEALLP